MAPSGLFIKKVEAGFIDKAVMEHLQGMIKHVSNEHHVWPSNVYGDVAGSISILVFARSSLSQICC